LPGTELKKVDFGDVTLLIDEGVYEPAEDTFLLARNLHVKPEDAALDIGTGSGLIAILLAKKAKEVVATDINPSSVRCTLLNAKLNQIDEHLEVICGNLFAPFRKGEKFDLVTFNPPYLPSEEGEGDSWIERGWSGGPSGRVVTDRFMDELDEHLRVGGRVLLIQSSLMGVDETVNRLGSLGFAVQVVDKMRFFYEDIVLLEAILHRKP